MHSRFKFLLPIIVLCLGAARLFAQVTQSSTNVPLAIPDNGNVNSTLNFTANGNIADVNLTFNISHTWDADVRLTLTSPSVGAQVLVENCGGSGDNFSNTTIDEDAAVFPCVGIAGVPFSGSFQSPAAGTLDAFDGTPSGGIWTLNVADDSTICTGTLNSWSLSISGNPPLPGELSTFPSVTSPTSTAVTATTATLGGNATADNGYAISVRGVVYSATATNNDPLIGGTGVTNLTAGSGVGVFTAGATMLTAATNYSYKAYATNGNGTSYTTVATFMTTAGCPTITLASLPNGTVGSVYSGSAVASGGTGPYTYSVNTGPLPNGLSLTPSGGGAGDVSGTPTATGSFRIAATDANSCGGVGNVAVIGSAIASGDLVIHEFRSRGPAGALDEYVEIANRSTSPLTLAATDGSIGFGIVSESAGLLATIANGTVIPVGGFYLASNSTGYSLSNYGGAGAAAHDASWTTDLPDSTGIGLFRSTSTFTSGPGGTAVDAVGFVGSSAPYLETTGITVSSSTGAAEVAYVRNTPGGVIQDTGNNANDFYLAETNAANFAPVDARLGTPGPQNLVSQRATGLIFTLANPAKGATVFPNRYRVGTGPTGTYYFRWKITNNTGAAITSLRIRVSNVTTQNSPGYTLAGTQADFRLVSSADAPIMVPAAVTALGLTLEPPPTGLPSSKGGYNTSAAVTLPGGTLLDGDSVYVNVGFSYQQAGSYTYFVSGEAK